MKRASRVVTRNWLKQNLLPCANYISSLVWRYSDRRRQLFRSSWDLVSTSQSVFQPATCWWDPIESAWTNTRQYLSVNWTKRTRCLPTWNNFFEDLNSHLSNTSSYCHTLPLPPRLEPNNFADAFGRFGLPWSIIYLLSASLSNVSSETRIKQLNYTPWTKGTWAQNHVISYGM